MKSTATFLGVLFGLSFLVSGAMLVTATMKPQWFMLGANRASADSLHTVAKKDSSAATAVRSDSAAILPDRSSAVGDSAGAGRATASAAALPQSGASAQVPNASPAAIESAAPKQDDLQSLVKLYDAMKPEDAAKILSKQPDKDIRAIILHVKKKQAAKILANFNADRAAQILAQ
jgi:hypothetical protein